MNPASCFFACICDEFQAFLWKILSYPKLRSNTMENIVDFTLESRKEWTAPELKKIDVDEITAGGNPTSNDDTFGGS